MHQRYEAQIGQFLFAPVRDRDLRRTLQRYVALIVNDERGVADTARLSRDAHPAQSLALTSRIHERQDPSEPL